MSTHSHVLATETSLGPAPALPGEPFGIYVHIPFCSHICPSCDFDPYSGQAFRVPGYVQALEQEIAVWSTTFAGREASSIFLGGGTPSLLSPAQVAQVLDAARDHFSLASDIEITLESN